MQQQVSICADCSSQSCEWCSVNRGVYLCVQCAAVHRQLGRHVSQVKHLTRSHWRASQLRMVHELAQAGANYIWEHLLLDPSAQQSSALNLMHGANVEHQLGKRQHSNSSSAAMWKKRKPMPHDGMHPTKVEFIREKYMFAAFFKRNTQTSQDDINQQLYASVRTNMVTTSLQLLAMGANPNFWNPNRGNTPLHVACQCSQVSQAELLITYGASLNRKDANGNTPLMIAFNQEQKHSGSRWSPLIACLIEAHYEVCDTLSLYLNQRTPDHSQVGQHFIVPQLPPINNNSQLAHHHQSLLRLAHLDQQAFADFSIDVCDDVMRRLSNRLVAGNQDYHLFFLPLHRDYSSTRNQARQKLARLGDDDTVTNVIQFHPPGPDSCGFRCVEFPSLVWDVLWECRRRMTLAVAGNGLNNRLSSSNQWQSVMSGSGVGTPDGEGDGPPVVLRPLPQAGVSSAGRFSFVPQTITDSSLGVYKNAMADMRERFAKEIAPLNNQDNMSVGPKRNSLPGLGTTDFIQEEEEKSLPRQVNENVKLSSALSNIDSLLLDPVYDHVPFDTNSEHAFSVDMTDSSYMNHPLPDPLVNAKATVINHLNTSSPSTSRAGLPLPEPLKVNREQQTEKHVPNVASTATQTSNDYLEEMERCRRLMEEWKTHKSVLEERNAQQQQVITKLELEVAKLLEEKMRAWSSDHLYPSTVPSTISSTPNISNTSAMASSSPSNLPASYTSGNPLWINTGVRMHQEVMGASGAAMLSRSNQQTPMSHEQRKEFTGTTESSPINRPYHMVNMKLPPPYRASPQLMNRDEYQKPVHPISRGPSQSHHPIVGISGIPQQHPHAPSSSSGSLVSSSSDQPCQFTVSQQDRLVTHVNYIASLVKQLLEFGQHNCRDEFVRCACQIQTAVEEMTHFMPTHVSGVDRQELAQALQAIMLHSRELRRQCENAVKQTSDTNLTHFITCAHDIIMATRTLLTSIYRLDR